MKEELIILPTFRDYSAIFFFSICENLNLNKKRPTKSSALLDGNISDKVREFYLSRQKLMLSCSQYGPA